MAICEDDGESRGDGHPRKWASAAVVFAGSMGIAIAAVFAAGTQLVSSPMATAGTTQATPWVPRPIFLPKPVPRPRTSINAQSAGAEAAKRAEWVQKASSPFSAMSEAMTNLGNALGSSDVAAMRLSCHQLTAAGKRFDATLPSPNDEINTESEAAVAEIGDTATACLADPADIAGVQTHATAANNHLAAVAKIASEGG